MAAYEFVALDAAGRRRKGVLEADSVRQIRQQLRDRGWAPLSVDAAAARAAGSPGRGLRFARGLSALDLAMITRHLATLIGSGLPVEEALNAAAQQANRPRVASMLLTVRARVLEGHSLAAALAEFPAAFDDLYRSTVSAGEHSGHLEQVLENLADFTERRQESGQNVQMALLYPVILVVVSLLIVGGLLAYVVPEIVSVYDDTGQELPLLTRVLIALSTFLADWGALLLLALVAAGVALGQLLRRPGPRLRFDGFLLRAPLARGFVRTANASQFANTLSILTSAGVPLVEAMRIAGQVVSNRVLRARIDRATRRVAEGSSLRAALDEVGDFPPLMLHMVASGEASGSLDAMLGRVARHLERDLQRVVTALLELLKPAMLLVMGGLVLLIVLAILLPILNLNQLVV
ncbi:MAG: type II secretion system inner membrane protein GspF [Pseudomonadales bacterium]|jgi:general secretion pathway protein F|nr:type II secretion system inner membrane protein GspF [Pseudomonadales bacterium]